MASSKKTRSTGQPYSAAQWGMWAIALIIAWYIITSFIQGYLGAGAFPIFQSASANGYVRYSKPTDVVCDTCAQSGQLAPPCKGSCADKNQSCKMVIETGLCTCVSG